MMNEGMDRLQALQTKFRTGEKEIAKLKRDIEQKTKILNGRQSELNVQKRANAARRDQLDELVPKVEAARLQVQELERSIEEIKSSQHAQFTELTKAEREVVNEEQRLLNGMKIFSQDVQQLCESQLVSRIELRKSLS